MLYMYMLIYVCIVYAKVCFVYNFFLCSETIRKSYFNEQSPKEKRMTGSYTENNMAGKYLVIRFCGICHSYFCC